MDKKLNLAVLISGGGTNLQALIDACADPTYPAEIKIVISNVPDVKGLDRAKDANIPSRVVNHKDYESREAFETTLNEIIELYDADLVCLAGFMRILTPVFIDRWQGKILNTHPSLLPKHGGEGMYGTHVHQAVLDAGDAESGVSIHVVEVGVDQGLVILQRTVPVEPADTAGNLAARVLAQEHIAYPEAVRLFAEDRVKIVGDTVEIL